MTIEISDSVSDSLKRMALDVSADTGVDYEHAVKALEDECGEVCRDAGCSREELRVWVRDTIEAISEGHYVYPAGARRSGEVSQ